MVTSSAPVLRGLKTTGGTFYTFSSTLRDFAYLFDNSTVRLAPSKFAAVKLPNWVNSTGQRLYKDPTLLGAPAITNPNDVFPKVIQNYVENLIQISEANRNDNLLENYGEAAFMKMLRDVGALNLEDSGQTVIENAQTKTVYREEVNSATYDRVFKFVGDINLLNHVRDGSNEYVEIFGLIPTESGLQEDILFKPGNMVHNASLIPQAGGPAITTGLDDFNGIENVNALYDNTVTNQYEVGSDLTDSGLFFQDLIDNSDTKSDKGQYDFNAILLYYDIFDTTDDTSLATNLYGILFIDDFDTNVAGEGEIPLFTKYQPDNNQPGNAYGFRMNLKFSNATNQVTSEISVNNYSTVSMELYMDALRRIQIATEKMEDALDIVREVKAENDRLVLTALNQQTILDSVTQITDHENRLRLLETANTEVGARRISNEEIFNLLNRTLTELQTASTNNTINITNLISDRLYLGTVIDPENNVIELNGNQYQWNISTQSWDLINNP